MSLRKQAFIVSFFQDLSDPRIDRSKKHLLIDIVVIAICAVLSGAQTWEAIHIFGKSKQSWFKKFLSLKNGIPSCVTFARVLSVLSTNEFEKSFERWVNAVCDNMNGEIIAVDGKRLRRSFDRASKKSAIHMVSAWACKNGVVFGQEKVSDKSNEITAIPRLLKRLELSGSIVTIDAMGCQKDIAKEIINKDGNYIFSLKGNQGNLNEEVIEKFLTVSPDNVHCFKTVESGHGRIETREYQVTGSLDHMLEIDNWSGLKSIIKVISKRETIDNTSEEERYYISSLKPDPQIIGKAIRKHWQVENCLHWVLDVTFSEDHCRIRNAHGAENFSIIRRIAINLLNKAPGKQSIKNKRLRCGWDNNYLLKVLLG